MDARKDPRKTFGEALVAAREKNPRIVALSVALAPFAIAGALRIGGGQ